MSDRLRLVPPPDEPPAPGDCLYTEQELTDAAGLALEQVRRIAEDAGRPVGDFVRSDLFGLHTLAYMITLRHTDTRVHERAAGLFFRLLYRTSAHQALATKALGHLYANAAQGGTPVLGPVED
ncbi:hypothetical protein [Streptomyces sp. URMC 129]|uniref:hypothetical protein n=1 Tax=Streptomyces sp. URMC 129 TaxID=3423407 RepID=UPI003F1C8144